MTTTEEWAQWEKQVINGVFPLLRAVSFSDHSAVFMTEHKALIFGDALLKLVPAIPTLRESQLAYWETATTLVHPNLIRLLEAGCCQLKGLQFLFVVMEYAEQTLAKLLTQRALAPGTLQMTLRPILASLAFLHRKNLVHGSLKPSNILLANHQLKLASDTVRPTGESTASIAGTSVYDPPESRDGSFSAAGDIWSLGVIMVEALTQRLPSWPERNATAPVLPEALPAQFVDIVWQCLNRDPAKRPTVADLEAQIDPSRELPAESVHYPVLLPPQPEPPAPVEGLQPHDRGDVTPATALAQQSGRHRWWAPVGVTTAILLTVGAIGVWAPLRMPSEASNAASGTSAAAPASAMALAAATLASSDAAPATSGTALNRSDTVARTSAEAEAPESADALTGPDLARDDPDFAENQVAPSVLHEETPDVPEGALRTIHGHIRFALRVKVGQSGEVVHVSLASRSPSRYFTRLAMQTARRWKFVAAGDPKPRQCLVWFDFTRRGAATHADAMRLRYAQGD